jgi:hypothetical protein
VRTLTSVSTNSTPKKPNRQQLRTAENQATFLREFAISGHLANSAKKAGVDRTTVFLWRDKEEFESLFKVAERHSVSVLEDEAHRRAFDGVDKPVYQGKELVGHIREYSDTLLIFLLKGKAPAKYRERYEITGKDGGPVQLQWMEDGNSNPNGNTSTSS